MGETIPGRCHYLGFQALRSNPLMESHRGLNLLSLMPNVFGENMTAIVS